MTTDIRDVEKVIAHIRDSAGKCGPLLSSRIVCDPTLFLGLITAIDRINKTSMTTGE